MVAVVVVGDRSKVEPALQRLNIGAIEIRDREGRPLSWRRRLPLLSARGRSAWLRTGRSEATRHATHQSPYQRVGPLTWALRVEKPSRSRYIARMATFPARATVT